MTVCEMCREFLKIDVNVIEILGVNREITTETCSKCNITWIEEIDDLEVRL